MSAWRLKIEGRVERPLELTLPDVLESPTKEMEALLECAGGPADGTAAGQAVWEEMPLARILEQAGVAHDARAVLLEGADSERLMQNSRRPAVLLIFWGGRCVSKVTTSD